MKMLDYNCILCYEKPVMYVKLKGGFVKLCVNCKELMYSVNLVVEDDVITPK